MAFPEAAVKFGLGLPQRKGADLRHDIVEAARTAELAGFASLWVHERLVPDQPADGYATSGLAWFGGDAEYADPLPVLAVAAAMTESVRLGASLLLTPLQSPAQLAGALATIDQISGGGRLIAGAGWPADELQAASATLAERGSRLDETLDVFDAAWGDDLFSYHRHRTALHQVLLQPKPVTKIPVLLGGTSVEAQRRIARRADGWLPAGIAPVAAGEMWQRIREAAAGYGRDTAAMTMIYRGNVVLTQEPTGAARPPFTGTMYQILDDIALCAVSGADELVLDVQPPGQFSTKAMLEMALEIRERAVASGI